MQLHTQLAGSHIMAMDPGLSAILGALSGGVLAGIAAIITTLIAKRVEERRHRREIIFNAAIENWKAAKVQRTI